MSEWWTYRPSDFLMFSQRTWHRLFELLNAEWWPLQPLLLALGAALLAMPPRAMRWGLAAAWLFVAWAFHARRLADIHTAAPWFAGAFVVQAVLMAAWRPAAIERTRPVLALMAVALAWPLLGLALGRPLAQAEVFGLAPDPTVAATLALLLAARAPAWAWALPLAWCAASGATLAVMGEPEAPLLPALGLAAAVMAFRSRLRSSRCPAPPGRPAA